MTCEIVFCCVWTRLALAETSTFSDNGADLHRDVDLDVVADTQNDSGLDVCLKSRNRGLQRVGADRQIRNRVNAVRVGDGAVNGARIDTGDLNRARRERPRPARRLCAR